jgi:hypothetical protein
LICDHLDSDDIVADFEFKYDLKAFRHYQIADNDGTKGGVRWPCIHLIAGAWATLTFKPGAVVPVSAMVA